ncbi:ABC transporter ATP-binding protein [Lacrimispora sp.]|uniref:ABC transporter ATP-binding protein n=1 Tax=Lacrimispora sp. TaxID=2719234 RepID=UPI0028A7C287|nr:ABC transporter ATP-binding protein [Lacrimispora sp.]
MAETVLNVQHLQVKFRVSKTETLTAIQDVTFSVKEGETLGIVGESGCGKSVTANTILRLLPEKTTVIAGGSINFEGQDLTMLSLKEMRKVRGNKISMIFQEPMTSLNPVYRIGDQMVEMYQANNSISKKEAWKKAAGMLEKVGIPSPEQRMHEFPHNLSGGMRQRVMIAMALSSEPALLIADEPTTALDVTIQAQVLELMRDLQNQMNTAVLLITHDMGVVAENADYVLVMYAGEVVEYGSARSIFKNSMHPYTMGLLESIPRLDQDTDQLNTIDGTVPSLSQMPNGCRFSNRCRLCMDRCKEETPELRKMEEGHQVRCFLY